MALFTKKDLGLILPDDEPGDPVSLRHTKTSDATEQFQELKPKVDPSAKVRRYRAGHVPEFAAGFEDDRGFVTSSQRVRGSELNQQKKKPGSAVVPSVIVGRRRVEAQVIKAQPGKAVAAVSRLSGSSDDSDGAEATRTNALDDSSSSEDGDEVDRRRQALRKKILEKEKSQSNENTAATELSAAARRPVVEAKVVSTSSSAAPVGVRVTSSSTKATESSSSGSESEWETDSDSDQGEALMKPVFVPKKARGTIKRQEELDAEEAKRQQKELEKVRRAGPPWDDPLAADDCGRHVMCRQTRAKKTRASLWLRSCSATRTLRWRVMQRTRRCPMTRMTSIQNRSIVIGSFENCAVSSGALDYCVAWAAWRWSCRI
jgi:microfibrillar-associated protein 1